IEGRPSRDIVDKALAGLVNLTHRGGVGADARTGDGAGLLLQIPHALFEETLAKAGAGDLTTGDYGVAMLFLPLDTSLQAQALDAVDEAAGSRGLEIIGRRDVPVRDDLLGDTAAAM